MHLQPCSFLSHPRLCVIGKSRYGVWSKVWYRYLGLFLQLAFHFLPLACSRHPLWIFGPFTVTAQRCYRSCVPHLSLIHISSCASFFSLRYTTYRTVSLTRAESSLADPSYTAPIMPVSHTISAAEWEMHRPTIQRLYLDEDLTLIDVMKHLREQGFGPSKGQYNRQLKRWNLSKSLKSKDWKRISRKIKARSEEGKLSQVMISGRIIPDRTVRKETSRHDPPTLVPQIPSPNPMEGILVYTPRTLSPVRLSPTKEDVFPTTSHREPANTEILTVMRFAPDNTATKIMRSWPLIIPDDLPYFEFQILLERRGKLNITLRRVFRLIYLKAKVLSSQSFKQPVVLL